MLFSTKSVDILTNPTTLCIIILIFLLFITFRQGEYSTKIIINFEANIGFFFIVANPNLLSNVWFLSTTKAPLRLQ